MNRPKENKEECCCEGTITREGAIHTKNSCCVYIENKEERHEHSMLCNGRNFGEGNKYFYGGNYTGMKEPENCDCKSEAPQTPELKGNKFTWSPEKAKELQEICDRLNKTPDSMEENYHSYCEGCKDLVPNKHFDCIREKLALAHSSGRREGIEEAITKTGFLRQWLNERTETRLVTDEDLQTFLKIGVKSLLDKDLEQ